MTEELNDYSNKITFPSGAVKLDTGEYIRPVRKTWNLDAFYDIKQEKTSWESSAYQKQTRNTELEVGKDIDIILSYISIK